LIAKQMRADARPPQPAPDCCERRGILWDLVAVYPAGTIWTDRMPLATMMNGPVVAVPDGLTSAMKAMPSGQ